MISRRGWAILPALVRRTTLLALAALALSAPGCLTPCEELGERICGCLLAGTARDNCNRAVKRAVHDARATEQQQDCCDLKLTTCPSPGTDTNACEAQRTEAGKVACGLAYDPATDAVGSLCGPAASGATTP